MYISTGNFCHHHLSTFNGLSEVVHTNIILYNLRFVGSWCLDMKIEFLFQIWANGKNLIVTHYFSRVLIFDWESHQLLKNN